MSLICNYKHLSERPEAIALIRAAAYIHDDERCIAPRPDRRGRFGRLVLTPADPSLSALQLLGPAVDHSPFGFLVFDPEGRLLAANRRARERLGFKPARLS